MVLAAVDVSTKSWELGLSTSIAALAVIFEWTKRRCWVFFVFLPGNSQGPNRDIQTETWLEKGALTKGTPWRLTHGCFTAYFLDTDQFPGAMGSSLSCLFQKKKRWKGHKKNVEQSKGGRGDSVWCFKPFGIFMLLLECLTHDILESFTSVVLHF